MHVERELLALAMELMAKEIMNEESPKPLTEEDFNYINARLRSETLYQRGPVKLKIIQGGKAS